MAHKVFCSTMKGRQGFVVSDVALAKLNFITVGLIASPLLSSVRSDSGIILMFL